MVVKIYTGAGCYHCKEAKEFFTKNNIEFLEFDVYKEKAAYDFVLSQGGQLPIIELNGSIYKGFDAKVISEALKL